MTGNLDGLLLVLFSESRANDRAPRLRRMRVGKRLLKCAAPAVVVVLVLLTVDNSGKEREYDLWYI